MNGLLKVSLGLGVSLVLASCQSLPETQSTASPAENKIVLVREDSPAAKSGQEKTNYQFAYYVPASSMSFILSQEVYQGGRLISQHQALQLSQIDSKGQLVLGVKPLAQGDYLVELKIIGAEVNQGSVMFQVKSKQQNEVLQTYQVTLAEGEDLTTTRPQALFALKFSGEEGAAVSTQFLNKPQEYLTEVSSSDLVYRYCVEFKQRN